MFEFSQVEYTVRHYLAEEISLNEAHFSAVIESYDVAMLISVAVEVFKKSRGDDSRTIWQLLNKFRGLNDERKRVAHGLWVPFKEGGTVHYVSRIRLSSRQFTDQAKELEQNADKLCQLRADLEKAFCAIPGLGPKGI
jgi:hypothetical protein